MPCDPPAPFHPAATRRPRQTVRVGVGVVVVNDNRIYAGRRRGSHGAGSLALPGGHLEMMEEWEECAKREVQEEMNVTLHDVKFLHVTNNTMPDEDKHYVTIFMTGRTNETPVNAEPEKCEGWDLFSLEELRAMVDNADSDRLFGPLERLLRENVPALDALFS